MTPEATTTNLSCISGMVDFLLFLTSCSGVPRKASHSGCRSRQLACLGRAVLWCTDELYSIRGIASFCRVTTYGVS